MNINVTIIENINTQSKKTKNNDMNKYNKNINKYS